ncbi:protein of unknown function [Candidatus Filomicrobium marinum]|uniref:Uncharacterized protein n=2 Tax=Filomicrobium TaxID=119044 RepID=A0A0D6JGM5_9HYPH|nr:MULTISPECIES: hypothetical protein [Filomicrobium]MCV0370038.1 hypothetical protein [Filomicrobium sp.]CFX27680.1 protein of unknown function [Candidatus Filomicrobium marinum]CPR19587.1 protein of unknown function [Candidatus Filomicrobium marinum]SDO04587.1 hypothetical protein SAMN04488061_0118 [Filomicrobium insigne]
MIGCKELIGSRAGVIPSPSPNTGSETLRIKTPALLLWGDYFRPVVPTRTDDAIIIRQRYCQTRNGVP